VLAIQNLLFDKRPQTFNQILVGEYAGKYANSIPNSVALTDIFDILRCPESA
jgi:hypothetical protein